MHMDLSALSVDVVSNPERSSLAVFSDASSIAMSARAYIFGAEQSTLVMAKCKLPSIRGNPTLPKMEMNALAIALRRALSVFQALKKRIPQCLKSAYIFSDSQVALSWLALNPAASNLGVLVNNRLKVIRRIVEAFNRGGVGKCILNLSRQIRIQLMLVLEGSQKRNWTMLFGGRDPTFYTTL
ncbi:unnamed protein product [Haemonchus placei]|uniref:RNase H domain-containing protein n=1 Tax=Haemonchus placei TaxID=6290 RepID=A0A0N4WLU3_HAEPC|nr:unnamed protein product [Haemonchus placei]